MGTKTRDLTGRLDVCQYVRHMAPKSTFLLYDRILNGKLEPLLLGWRAEGVSITDMAFRLREEQIKVAPETVRRWLRRIDEQSAA